MEAIKEYMNAAQPAEQRAADLLAEMSTEEKMAQLNCYLPQRGDPDGVRRECPKGVGHISCLEMRSMTSLKEVADFQRQVQENIMELTKHHIPAIFHMEGLCGAFIQGAASFPSGIGRASAWDPELEEKVGEIVSRQEKAVGITQVFAPVLDISRDSRMGRQGETYGEDPTLAASLGSAMTRGIQEGEMSGGIHRKADAVAKHFLGFHNSQGGIHGANCDIGERLLQEVYGKPFQAAITEAGLKGIMPCYCSINGEPISASEEVLTGLLRGDMGFDGVTVSDYCAVMNVHQVQKVCESFTEAGLRSMAAGMDVELHFKKCFNEELAQWFESGKADMALLDRAVLRVLTAKFRMGLFEQPFALDGQALAEEFYRDEDAEIALQSARESLILLKNDGVLPLKKEGGIPLRKDGEVLLENEGALPLKNDKESSLQNGDELLDDSHKKLRLAVIGCHAINARTFFGGYTHLSMAEGLLAALNSMAGIEASGNDGKAKMVTIPGTPIQSDEQPEFDAVLKMQKPECKCLLEEMKQRLSDWTVTYAYGYPVAGNDTSHFEEALEAVRNADVVVLTLGGKHGTSSIASMGEGVDGTDINLPECQESFIRLSAKEGKPMIGIHFNGRPISSDAADECLNAVIEAWNPAEGGAEAIVDVLTGKVNPSGKLPVSVAFNAGQIPIYYNHPNGSAWHQGESIGFANYVDMPHKPRYFFGHGLSYTSFEYSELSVERAVVLWNEPVTLSFTVKNAGGCEGTEIVQLYLSDTYASMTRPALELAGFARVALAPGEARKVSFIVNPDQMAFLDRNMKWKVEAGEITVLVGASSADIRLKGSFKISGDGIVEGKKRTFYAKPAIL